MRVPGREHIPFRQEFRKLRVECYKEREVHFGTKKKLTRPELLDLVSRRFDLSVVYEHRISDRACTHYNNSTLSSHSSTCDPPTVLFQAQQRYILCASPSSPHPRA